MILTTTRMKTSVPRPMYMYQPCLLDEPQRTTSDASYCAQTSRASIGAKVLMFPAPRWAAFLGYQRYKLRPAPHTVGSWQSWRSSSGWWATPAGDVGRRGTFGPVVPREQGDARLHFLLDALRCVGRNMRVPPTFHQPTFRCVAAGNLSRISRGAVTFDDDGLPRGVQRPRFWFAARAESRTCP
jgi:hypothetical protein